jgi:hypothetical protein
MTGAAPGDPRPPRPRPPRPGPAAPGAEPGQPAFRGEFDAELRRDASYESGLARKALVALAVVAVLIAIRLLGF